MSTQRSFFSHLFEELDDAVVTPEDAVALLDIAIEEATVRLSGTATEDLLPQIKAELRDELRERYGV